MQISRTTPKHSPAGSAPRNSSGRDNLPRDTFQRSDSSQSGTFGFTAASFLPGLGAVTSALGARACIQDGHKVHGAGLAFSALTNAAGTLALVNGIVSRDLMAMGVGLTCLAGTAVQNFVLLSNLQDKGVI